MNETTSIIQDPTMSPEAKTHCLLGLIVDRLAPEDSANVFKDIEEFHKKFNQFYNGPPRDMPEHMQKFRTDFLDEEVEELGEAFEANDRAKVIDAIFDIVYVAIGTAYLMGVDFDAVWKEGHASNMSKESVAMGKGKMGFTVNKGDNYFKPNFNQFTQ